MERLRTFAALGVALLSIIGSAACRATAPADEACTPADERCNGRDDDCDGEADEGFAVNEACTAGTGACRATGALRCTEDGAGVACDAVAGTPSAETCNQDDDDCDELVDEGLPGCCTPTAVQACGVTSGVCTAGTQTCTGAGEWGACLSGGAPVVLPGERSEVCNGLDDDCDGTADELLAAPACDNQHGACAGSVKVCSGAGGWLACGAAQYGSDYQATETACDGIDNDCDGTTDEDACSSTSGYVADHLVAQESVLRAIPQTYVDTARTTLHVAYFHTSHGTHVTFGASGLPDYKAGDAERFGITVDAAVADPTKLDLHDYYNETSPPDLSVADTNGWAAWMTLVRDYLDAAANADVNVMMWSWCDISGHSVPDYLSSMQTLIDEYGVGGSKIGTGTGKTRTTPVTFVFMTGHAVRGSNLGAGHPRDQAALITAYCTAHAYLCLDYYAIDTHAMNGTYYEDAGDDGDSGIYAQETPWDDGYVGHFYGDWQAAHTEGVDWYENRETPGGDVMVGAHNTQHVTANRKAYAFWWVLARIAGMP